MWFQTVLLSQKIWSAQFLKPRSSMKSKGWIHFFWTLTSSLLHQLSSYHRFRTAISLSWLPHPNRICTHSFRGQEQISVLWSTQASQGHAASNVKENSNSMLNNWFVVYASHRLIQVLHHPTTVALFPRNVLEHEHLWCPVDRSISTSVEQSINSCHKSFSLSLI